MLYMWTYIFLGATCATYQVETSPGVCQGNTFDHTLYFINTSMMPALR